MGRIPWIDTAEDALSGSLHSHSVSRRAGSFALGRDDKLRELLRILQGYLLAVIFSISSE